MKKNILIKGILVLVVITLLTIGFVGCVQPGIYIFGTVVITVSGDWVNQMVYMDGAYQYTFNPAGSLTLYNVPVGNHLFESWATDLWTYGYAWSYIHTGINYIHIYVSY